MDFKDEIKQLSERINKIKDQLQTEEATKNSLIMPFIKALGYDVFNPHEVTPEYITDIGIKKGEKIDYAILDNGSPIILIECKHWGQKLDLHDNQLLRYFHVSKAKFAILTNGILFNFYTDLVSPNIMDEKPFLVIDMNDIRENQFEELKKFHKSYFNIDNILSSASELKYTNEIIQLLHKELNNPSIEFVKFFAKQIHSGVLTQKMVDLFVILMKKSSQQYISNLMTDRFKTAIKKETEQVIPDPIPTEIENKIFTTDEEKESYFIVKTILRKHIPGNRIAPRDAQSYFSILLDDNNRQPICRLYLNSNKKYIGLFDKEKTEAEKKETKMEIYELDDIFNYEKNLLSIVKIYDGVSEDE